MSKSPIAKLFHFATYLTMNFFASNMQQNQISLVLLHVAGNKYSCFKDILEKNLCVTTF